MSAKITSVLFSTYILGTAAQNPLTVAATGEVEVNSATPFANAITGNSGFSWAVTNLGIVESLGNYGVGISLGSGGAVTNGAAGATGGYIRGVSVGVQINGTVGNSAAVVNYGAINAISPSQFANAIAVNGVAGAITNSGQIIGYNTGTGSANAIQLGSGGVIVNHGLVNGFSRGNNENAIVAFAGTTELFNTGTIEALGSNGNGVNVIAGNIGNSGLVEGAGQAISIATGYVGNSGTLSQAGMAGAEAVNLGAGGGSGTLANTGAILSYAVSGSAVLVGSGGGKIVNGQTGLISAYHTGIGFFPAPGTGNLAISNYGAIQSTQAGAAAGAAFAINIGGGSTNVINNFGKITSAQTNGGGAILLGGGRIANGFGALIGAPGGTGINSQGAALVVTNFGTIAGGGPNGFGAVLGTGSTLTNAGTMIGQAAAVSFAGGGGSRLIVDPGAVFGGVLAGNDAALELAEGSGTVGTLSGFGPTVASFASLQFDGAARWTVEGTAAGFPGTITGFQVGDTMVVDGFAAVSDTFANNALTLTDASNNQISLAIQGNFTTADFTIAPTNAGTGTAIMDTTDITPPTPVNDNPLSIGALSTGTITQSLLRFDDDGSTHAQATYTVLTAPADGTLLKGGSPAATFTQADIDNGLIGYHETVTGASSDSFSFTVSDAAGNMTGTEQFNVAITPPATLYDFYFLYSDDQAKGAGGGDYYYGTVADDGRFGYSVGESIAAPLGTYVIYANAGATAQPAGTVDDFFYWDGAGSHQAYGPYYSSHQGFSPVAGGGGLGNDFDYLLDSSGQFHLFSDASEAIVHTSTVFDFYFSFSDLAANGSNGGDYYYGTVTDDGRFGYAAGMTIATSLGSYHIYGTAGTTAQAAGTVDDYFYWDGAGSQQAYTPYYSAQQGHSPVSGAGGLGNDFDYIFGIDNQFHAFGGNFTEAKA